MINYKNIYKAGLCTILGSVLFSLFFWNGYMIKTGRFMIWNEFGHAPLLMFAMFLMPVISGLVIGFSCIFYSLHLEQK